MYSLLMLCLLNQLQVIFINVIKKMYWAFRTYGYIYVCLGLCNLIIAAA